MNKIFSFVTLSGEIEFYSNLHTHSGHQVIESIFSWTSTGIHKSRDSKSLPLRI